MPDRSFPKNAAINLLFASKLSRCPARFLPRIADALLRDTAPVEFRRIDPDKTNSQGPDHKRRAACSPT